MYARQHRRAGAGASSCSRTPRHPYTLGLLQSDAAARRRRAARRLQPIRGPPPTLLEPPPRLPVRAALPLRVDDALRPRCRALVEVAPGHVVACSPVPADDVATRSRGGAARERRRRAAASSSTDLRASGSRSERRRCSSATSATCGRSTASTLDDPPRRDARPRRRVGLRQDDASAARSCGSSSRRAGAVAFDGAGHHAALGERSCADCAGACRWSSRTRTRRSNPRMTVGEIVGEPLRVARARRRRRDARGARRASCSRRVGLTPDAASTAIRTSSPAASASASASRARSRSNPDFIVCRRAGLGARRLDPGADHQPARATCRSELGAHLSLHRARPRRRAPHRRPRRGDVPRPASSRSATADDALRRAAASVHAGAAVGGADPGPAIERQRERDRAAGRPAEPGEPAGGVPLPHALPVRAADEVPRRAAGSCASSTRATSSRATGPRRSAPAS